MGTLFFFWLPFTWKASHVPPDDPAVPGGSHRAPQNILMTSLLLLLLLLLLLSLLLLLLVLLRQHGRGGAGSANISRHTERARWWVGGEVSCEVIFFSVCVFACGNCFVLRDVMIEDVSKERQSHV